MAKKTILKIVATIILSAMVGAGLMMEAPSQKRLVGDTLKPTVETQEQTLSKQIEKSNKLAEVLNNIMAGGILVDVRTPEEYQEQHAVGAQNIPYDKIVAGQYPTADKPTKIYLYCKSGKRAGLALNALKAAGYSDVISLGGLTDWQALGGEVR